MVSSADPMVCRIYFYESPVHEFFESPALNPEGVLLKPFTNGRPESLLCPEKHTPREYRSQCLLKKVLGLPMAELIIMWNSANEVDQIDIQKRSTDLEGVHHAGTVNLDQDVVLQIELCVELERLVNHVFLCAGIPTKDCFFVGLLNIGSLLK